MNENELKKKVEELEERLDREQFKRFRNSLIGLIMFVLISGAVSWLYFTNGVSIRDVDVTGDPIITVDESKDLPGNADVSGSESESSAVDMNGGKTRKLYGEWGGNRGSDNTIIVGLFGLPKEGYNKDLDLSKNIRFFSFRCNGNDQSKKVLNPTTGSYFEVNNRKAVEIHFPDQKRFDLNDLDTYDEVVKMFNESSKFVVLDEQLNSYEFEAVKNNPSVSLPCGK